jgi:hypothetical protein
MLHCLEFAVKILAGVALRFHGLKRIVAEKGALTNRCGFWLNLLADFLAPNTAIRESATRLNVLRIRQLTLERLREVHQPIQRWRRLK